MNPNKRRMPILGIGVQAARRVRAEIGYSHPTELALETLAFMRGALVTRAPVTGARANLVRTHDRGIIGVAANLSSGERRWAIAHELGHYEAHANVSFLELCSGRDMVSAYTTSGREPEANAFAAELLLPEDLVRPRCDVAEVSWSPVRALADQFDVSITAAAMRFVSFTDERVCLVCARDGKVLFGPSPRRDTKIQPFTECYEWFAKGAVEARPQTVSASAWIESAGEEQDIVEHLFPLPMHGAAMSLLWWKSAS